MSGSDTSSKALVVDICIVAVDFLVVVVVIVVVAVDSVKDHQQPIIPLRSSE
jgi:hypothetical protein